MDEAQKQLVDLKKCVDSDDLVGGKTLLNKLKIGILGFPLSPSTQQIRVAVDALELGVLLTISDGDLDAFARNISQLKPYYDIDKNYSSDKKCHILGLNLMYLLVDNRLSEFHSELELLSETEANSSYISFPINLERQLMVGIYDEVLNAGLHVPDRSYTFFMNNLLQTVRDSIADCLEVSYKTLTCNDAKIMMKFDTQNELTEYIQECRDDWIVKDEKLWFQAISGTTMNDGNANDDIAISDSIPSMKLISHSLTYATEMERIV